MVANSCFYFCYIITRLYISACFSCDRTETKATFVHEPVTHGNDSQLFSLPKSAVFTYAQESTHPGWAVSPYLSDQKPFAYALAFFQCVAKPPPSGWFLILGKNCWSHADSGQSISCFLLSSPQKSSTSNSSKRNERVLVYISCFLFFFIAFVEIRF